MGYRVGSKKTLLSGFGMDKVFAYGVNFDILCIVDIHKLFVDVGALGPGGVQLWVILA